MNENDNNNSSEDTGGEGFVMPEPDGVTSGIPTAPPPGSRITGGSSETRVPAVQRKSATVKPAAQSRARLTDVQVQSGGLTVRTKLLGSLFLIVALVAVFGITAVVTLNSLSTTSTRIALSYAKLTKKVEEAKQTVYQIRDAEKDFMLLEENEAVERAARYTQKLRDQLEEAKEIAQSIEADTGLSVGERYTMLAEKTDEYEAGLTSQFKSIRDARDAVNADILKTDEFKRQLLVEVEANRVRMADIIINHWQTAKRGLNQTNVKIGNQLDEIDKNFLNVQIAVAQYLNSEDQTFADQAQEFVRQIQTDLDTVRLSAGESGLAANLKEVKTTLSKYSAILKDSITNIKAVNTAQRTIDDTVENQKADLKKIGDDLLKMTLSVTDENWGLIQSESVVLEKVSQTALTTLSSLAILAIVVALVVAFTVPLPIVRTINELAESARAIAIGDLTKTIQVTSNDELGQLSGATEQMRRNLVDLVLRIQAAAAQTSSAVRQIQAASAEQSASATQQASTVNELSTTLTEVSQSADALANSAAAVATRSGDLSRLVNTADEASRATLEAMDAIGTSTGDTSNRINALNDKMEAITEAVSTIATVADQTTLLSMNASIEANKAGEAGTGFTVVATEIRRLADRTIGAGSQIGGTVRDIRHATESSVMAMDKTSESIKLGIEKVRRAADDLEAINSNMGSIAHEGEQMARSLRSQSQATQAAKQTGIELLSAADSTALAARQTSAAAYDLSATATQLSDAVAQFRLS
ncbi:MAG: methyl-accepting chemotaxis protein [Myxococcota bacterium]|nr:methyl-accepting chemotaxis protein [Myxococcota bacterium]